MFSQKVNEFYIKRFENPQKYLIIKKYRNIITEDYLEKKIANFKINFEEFESLKILSKIIIKKYLKSIFLPSLISTVNIGSQKNKKFRIFKNLFKEELDLIEKFEIFYNLQKIKNRKDLLLFLGELEKIEKKFLQILEIEYFLSDLLKIFTFTLILQNPNWKVISNTNSKNQKIEKILNIIENYKKENSSVIATEEFLKELKSKKKEKLIYKKVPFLQNYYNLILLKEHHKLKKILLEKPSLITYNFPYVDFDTIFHIAALNGDMDLIKYLLKIKKKGIQLKNKNNETPIFRAIDNKDLAMVKYLVKKGSDISIKNRKGNNLLHYSLDKSSDEISEYLIKIGCDVNNQNKQKRTPIMKAIFLCKKKITEILLQQKSINLNLKDSRQQDILHLVCWGPGSGEEKKKHKNIFLPEFDEGLRLLLDRNLDLNTFDVFSDSPVLISVKTNSFKCLEILHFQNANFNHINRLGENAFLVAVRHSNIQCLQFIIKNEKCDIFLKNAESLCSLLLSMHSKASKEVFLFLIDIYVSRKQHFFVLDKIETILGNFEYFESLLTFIKEKKNDIHVSIFENYFFEIFDENLFAKFLLFHPEGKFSNSITFFLEKIFEIKNKKKMVIEMFLNNKKDLIKFYLEKNQIFLEVLKNSITEVLKKINSEIFENFEIMKILIENINLEIFLNYENENKKTIFILLVEKNNFLIFHMLIDFLKARKDLKEMTREIILKKDIYFIDVFDYIIKMKKFEFIEKLEIFLNEEDLKNFKFYFSSIEILESETISEKYQLEIKERFKKKKINKNFINQIKNNPNYIFLKKQLEKENFKNTFDVNLEDLQIKIKFIADIENLKKMINFLEKQKIIAFDMEYLEINQKETNVSVFSLIQILSDKKVFIVDALLLHEELKTHLRKILENEFILKIFHGSVGDLTILLSYLDTVVNFFLDTSVLYKIYFNSKITKGLKFLTSKAFDFQLDKSLQRSKWNIRPIPYLLKKYAVFDVIVLIPLLLYFFEINEDEKKINMALKHSQNIYKQINFEKIIQINKVLHLKQNLQDCQIESDISNNI